jgi:hypothetical protein
MAGTGRTKKPATSGVQGTQAATDELARVSPAIQTEAATAETLATRKSIETVDPSGTHDVESNADVSQSANFETGSSAPRESLESLPRSDGGDVERP